MKKVELNSKLKLEKFQINKLNNIHLVKGGSDIGGGGDGTVIRTSDPEKCKNLSDSPEDD